MNSSISISAAVTACARTYMYDFIVKYNALYTDTDCLFTEKELDPIYVGTKLGQFKLEHEIKKGIFIRNKLYIIQNTNDDYIIKASGVDGTKLNWNNFVDLLNGKSLVTKRITFNLLWNQMKLNVVEQNIKLNGIDINNNNNNNKDLNDINFYDNQICLNNKSFRIQKRNFSSNIKL